MFSKKCPRCARKISKDFDFCPFCGLDFRMEKRMKKQEDFGLLGKDDSIMPEFSPMPGMNPMIDGFLKNAIKMLNRELGKTTENKINNGMNFQISINGKRLDLTPQKKVEIKNQLSDEQARKFSKLLKKEAKTEVRRMSNRVIYELELPGVKSMKEVIINKLENSIEIKAFSSTTAYFKIIPVNLQLVNYQFEKEKLILELKAN
jgi:HSP20 family molecular chaperone IbpA